MTQVIMNPEVATSGPVPEKPVTSMFLACASFSLHFGHLCCRALLSEDFYSDKQEDPQWKLPGGMLEGNETMEKAISREWAEETMREHSRVSINMVRTYKILTKDVPDQDHPGGTHRKVIHWFDETDLRNYRNDIHFRASPTIEPPHGDKPGGILYLAQPIRVPTLCRFMRQTNSWFHREGLVLGTRAALNMNPVWARFLPRDFLDWLETDDYLVSDEEVENRRN